MRRVTRRIRGNPRPQLIIGIGIMGLLAVVALLAGTPAPARAADGGSPSIQLLGTTSVGTSTGDADGFDNPLRGKVDDDDDGGEGKPFLPTFRRKPLYKKGPQLPNPSSTKVEGADSTYHGFAGLDIIDHLQADDGKQLGLEPPDQALAVGNGYVLEAVNTTMAIYDKSGNLEAGPTSLNQFFVGDHMYDYTQDPPTFGAFLADPTAFYDADSEHWFMAILYVASDPETGAFDTSDTAVLVAVSKTSDPTGDWWVYSVDTTDIGLPDYPMIGVDENGLYISVNAFAFPTATTGYEFTGGYVYAVQKSALTSGNSSPNIVRFGSLLDDLGAALQPATTPPGGSFCTSNGGTEYFMSTIDWDGTLDDEILVWALTNTSSLDDATPSLTLHRKVVGTQDYGFPPPAEQKDGDTPLRDLLEDGGLGAVFENDLSYLSSNDDRMHQVVYADGMLWGGANTVVKSSKKTLRTGVAYFIVEPYWSKGDLKADVVKQGYVSVQNNNCLFPTLGVTAQGKGVMTFTLVGPDYYPTVAYARIDTKHGAGQVHMAASGLVPEDGFSGYSPWNPAGVSRWGDYSCCAVDDETGEVWFAGELTIDDENRPWFANWGTHVGCVKP